MIAALLAPAFADQTAFDLERTPATTTFSYRWTDDGGRAHAVGFALPAPAVEADEARAAKHVQGEMPGEVAARIRERVAGKVVDVEITVTADANGVAMGASGTGDVAAAMALASRVHDEVLDEWLVEHRHTRFALTDQDTNVHARMGWDLPRLVLDYADDLAPVAAALREGATDDRAFVERALSFVQSIPYERLRADGSGYRPPLAVLSTNRGDCDSKAVLFLGLVRAAAPDVPLAVVHVPGHVVVGLGLERRKGDEEFGKGAGRYVYAEPVGPGMYPLGQLDPKNLAVAPQGVVRPVAAGPAEQ